MRLPLRPPASFVLDPFVPLLPPQVDAWFGFNPLACARGLVARAQRRARRVVLWSVDFVPDRFGRGTLPTRVYDRLDRLCCIRADARIELSEAARDARRPPPRPSGRRRRRARRADGRLARPRPDDAARRLPPAARRLPRTSRPAAGRRRRCSTAAGSTPGRRRSRRHRHRPAGTGAARAGRARRLSTSPSTATSPITATSSGCSAESSVAVAPYAQTDETFTRYADPGKLKAYLAAGLPIVLTDVPPNARELERRRARSSSRTIAAALADCDLARARLGRAVAGAARVPLSPTRGVSTGTTLLAELARGARSQARAQSRRDRRAWLATTAGGSSRPTIERAEAHRRMDPAQQQRRHVGEHEHEPDRSQRSRRRRAAPLRRPPRRRSERQRRRERSGCGPACGAPRRPARARDARRRRDAAGPAARARPRATCPACRSFACRAREPGDELLVSDARRERVEIVRSPRRRRFRPDSRRPSARSRERSSSAATRRRAATRARPPRRAGAAAPAAARASARRPPRPRDRRRTERPR